MTYIALRFARYVNGVAMQHGKVSQQMFPGYRVHAITNGVHAATWLSDPMQELLDAEIPEWRHDNHYFRSIYGVAPAKISNCHEISKQRPFLHRGLARRSGRAVQPQDADARLRPPRCHIQSAPACSSMTPSGSPAWPKKIGGLQILLRLGKAHPADVMPARASSAMYSKRPPRA